MTSIKSFEETGHMWIPLNILCSDQENLTFCSTFCSDEKKLKTLKLHVTGSMDVRSTTIWTWNPLLSVRWLIKLFSVITNTRMRLNPPWHSVIYNRLQLNTTELVLQAGRIQYTRIWFTCWIDRQNIKIDSHFYHFHTLKLHKHLKSISSEEPVIPRPYLIIFKNTHDSLRARKIFARLPTPPPAPYESIAGIVRVM